MLNLVNNLTQKIIKYIKNDSNYFMNENVNNIAITQILIRRLTSILRGSFLRLFLKKSKGFLFVGPRISIRHPQFIKIGRGITIEDNVSIDALSINGINLGDNIKIARGTTIECTGIIKNIGFGLKVGSNSAIGAYSFIGAQGGITIGENVIIGPHVNFHSENHNFTDSGTLIRLQGESRKGIVIEDNCWIGAGCIILDGTYIESGSVVAAGSVVSNHFPPNSVLSGVPAKLLKNRVAKAR